MAIELLMPKGTALWLIYNTKLSFRQIAKFCNMHILEIQNLADSEDINIAPFDPMASGQLTLAKIKICEENPKEDLKINEATQLVNQKTKAKYVPLSRRSDRPNAILWLIKNYPKLSDSDIRKSLGGTAKMIESIRDKSYSKYETLIPQNPVTLYLCTLEELDVFLKNYDDLPA